MPSYFKKALAENDFVFIASTASPAFGEVALVLKQGFSGEEMTLADALKNAHNSGTFVFAREKLPLEDAAKVETFKNEILKILTERKWQRAIIWLKSPVITSNNVAALGFNNSDIAVAANFDMSVSADCLIRIPKGNAISVSTDGADAFVFTKAGIPAIQFVGSRALQSLPVSVARLSMTGSNRGAFVFNASLKKLSLIDKGRPGFQVLFSPGGQDKVVNEYFPFMEKTDDQGDWDFSFEVDPVDLFNEASQGTYVEQYRSRRTHFDFISTGEPLLIASFYRTIFNEKLNLEPVLDDGTGSKGLTGRFLFTRSKIDNKDDFIISPEGDFILHADEAPEYKPLQLMCALSGTEYISFLPYTVSYPGDRLTLVGNQPAYINVFPLPEASPTGPPLEPDKDLLDTTFVTSYAYVQRANTTENTHYVSQPTGMEMFGYDRVIHKNTTENPLGFIELGMALPSSGKALFPMFPYAGVIPGDGKKYASAGQMLQVEWGILFPKRRREIASQEPPVSLTAARSLFNARDDLPKSSATPSGQVALYEDRDGNDIIKEMILGQSFANGEARNLSFSEPGNELIEAMMTKDLFLVIANPKYTGVLNSTGVPVVGPSFNNFIQIEDWGFHVNLGSNAYADYSNIIIIKGIQGVLYDENIPAGDRLTSSPDKWTQAGKFAAPSTRSNGIDSEPDPSQLSALTRWMNEFFANAFRQKEDPYFRDLVEKAASPTWTGILFLETDVILDKIPDSLIPLLGGLEDPGRFRAHHIGINLSQVEKGADGPQMKELSSFFGLIHYTDRQYRPSANGRIQPVVAQTSADYDFRVLTLKVLFKNSSINAFESFSQLVINRLFKMEVSGMSRNGNALNALILKGLYQKRNNLAYYSLDTIEKYAFYFDNNIFNKIEITSAALLLKKKLDNNGSESVFNMKGFLDFAILGYQGEDTRIAMDILSFGSGPDDPPGEANDKGLQFSNLGINMTFVPENPATKPVYLEISDGLDFDVTASTVRDNSLYNDFALNVYSWLDSADGYQPEDYGYFGIVTDLNINKITQGKDKHWYGIGYKLDLGSPGELAGEVALDSYLLLAWSSESRADDRYELFIGLKLPGLGGTTKIIDLQNVLKLSIGQSKLLYVPVKEGEPPSSYMLLLTDIALKFLGFLKIPPNGFTNFYLFGNKEAVGEASSLGWYAHYKK